MVVTVGYRLGALGFLGLDGGDTNCGLRDQLAALAWVAEHATAIGGDAGCVTVMGESAGAGSVLHLLASPRSAGAFGRAIAQSGEPRTLSREMADEVAARFTDQFSAAASADELRSVGVDALLDAQTAVSIAMLGKVGPMAFAPAIDDDVCQVEILDGVTTAPGVNVDIVLGTTRDELALFPDPKAATLADDRLERRIGHLLGGDGTAAVETYRAQLGTTATNGAVWDAARTDAMMRVPNLRVADADAAAGGRTFVYRFDWAAPALGAAHGVDLPFTFGTEDREGWADVVGWDDRAAALAATWRGELGVVRRHRRPGQPDATMACARPGGATDHAVRPGLRRPRRRSRRGDAAACGWTDLPCTVVRQRCATNPDPGSHTSPRSTACGHSRSSRCSSITRASVGSPVGTWASTCSSCSRAS